MNVVLAAQPWNRRGGGFSLDKPRAGPTRYVKSGRLVISLSQWPGYLPVVVKAVVGRLETEAQQEADWHAKNAL